MRGGFTIRQALAAAAAAVAIAAPPTAAAGDPALSAVPPTDDSSGQVPEIRYKDTKPPPGLWRRPAGKWLTAAGFALLAGGATVAVLNDRLAKDLDERYARNQLTPADASSYRRVDAYNVLSASLLAGGGAVAAVGLYLWATAPDLRPAGRGVTFGVKGRF